MPREINSLNNLIFDPSLSRRRQEASPVRNLNLNDASSTAASSTGSFRFDPPGAALKSSQQLNVDFSNFENHTFFGSAQAKVQKAFSKIINSYPFDGKKYEIDLFLDGLTGFEKYVFDSFAKNIGYLAFSGSTGNTSTDGTYLSVYDFQGSFSPSLSKKNSGESVIDFGTKPFTAEFYLSVPSGSNNQNSIIAQKISGTNGLTIALSGSAFLSSPLGQSAVIAIINSGTQSLTASMVIEKGSFQHCAVVLDRSAGAGQIKMYNNSVLVATSSYSSFGQIDFAVSPMTIGSGTNAVAGNYTFQAASTLSGALDEFRFWHKAKTQREIYFQQFNNVFQDNDLKLYYRFNEPSGTFNGSGQDLILDYSGNGLHSRVSNFSLALRSTSSFGEPPLSGENLNDSPVLFPTFAQNVSLHEELISSASTYDANNPNLVTKLIPRHYFLEAKFAEGFETEDGNISDEISVKSDQPGGAKVGQAQIISSILYTMSETFDELKMFVDEFKRLLKVDYVSKDTISDQLLPWLSSYYGIRIPNVFQSANVGQISDGKNVRLSRSPTVGLQTIQNALWRRVFSDLPKNFSSRGTMESLKSTLRNFGINADGPVRIRELGGSKTLYLGDSYLKRHEVASMLDFSGTLAGGQPAIFSSYLSGSRTEPGYPQISGNFVNGFSNQSSDGLFTSGSWSFEGTYKFIESLSHPSPQSLARIVTTGSVAPASTGEVIFNLVAYSENIENSTTASLQLWGRPNSQDNTTPYFVLNLTGVNVFDGDKWQVSFGRFRNDSIDSFISSSYFVRASKFTVGGLQDFSSTSVLFDENGAATPGNNILQNKGTHNASGSFIVIGNQNIASSPAYSGLNDSTNVSDLARTTTFSGKVSGLRFWSKGLSEQESIMHARNFKSLGVDDPALNFNFVTTSSGSFERLRVDVSTDQAVTQSDSSGNIQLFDFSQNNLVFSGRNFENSKRIISPERFDFEVLSPDFKSEAANKIRIRSFLNSETAVLNGSAIAPLNIIPQNEEPKDDKRVQIEVSAVQALNEDIMNIFATLNYLDNGIGSPELVFAQDYPALRNLRRIYFNRLTSKINLTQFFQFFKWFDEAIAEYLEQMLPYDSKTYGSSFVVEPHALERPKFIYNYYDMYLGEENRGGKDLLLLQLLTATLRKF